jgi:hypothetical protein
MHHNRHSFEHFDEFNPPSAIDGAEVHILQRIRDPKFVV